MSKRVLLTPLDWGLGHATRCIPIIKELLKHGCEVILAGNGASLQVLQLEFPQLSYFKITSYQINYSQHLPLSFGIIIQIPKMVKAIRKEHLQIEKLIAEHEIDFVISDNRFGAWSRNVKSVFITHQVTIIMPKYLKAMQGVINYFNYKKIKKFDECWLPDYEGEHSLSGKLSRHKKSNSPFSSNSYWNGNEGLKLIGTLSRFKKIEVEKKYKIVALVSGPEPQRQIFEDLLRNQILQSGLKALLVKGKPDVLTTTVTTNNLEEVSHLKAEELNLVIAQAEIVICRSGYSTIMDLERVGAKAIFIPTPGQTEQEYLAEYFMQNQKVFSQPQRNFKLEYALLESKKYLGFISFSNRPNLLAQAIDELLK